MPSFEDAQGRQWHLALNVQLIAEVRSKTSVNFNKAIKGWEEFVAALFDAPETIARVLWLLVEAQAEKQAIPPEEFSRSLDGPAIHRAVEALQGAIIDFFHPPAVATALKSKVPTALRKVEAKTIQLMDLRLDAMIDEAIERLETNPTRSSKLETHPSPNIGSRKPVGDSPDYAE